MVQRRGRILPRLLVLHLFAMAALCIGIVGSAASSGTTIAAGSATLAVGSQATTTTVVTRSADHSNFNAFEIALPVRPCCRVVDGVAAPPRLVAHARADD